MGQTWKDPLNSGSLSILDRLVSKKLGFETVSSQILSGPCARTYNEQAKEFSAFRTGSWSEKMQMLGRIMVFESVEDPARKCQTFLLKSLFSFWLWSWLISSMNPDRISYYSFARRSLAVSEKSWKGSWLIWSKSFEDDSVIPERICPWSGLKLLRSVTASSWADLPQK